LVKDISAFVFKGKYNKQDVALKIFKINFCDSNSDETNYTIQHGYHTIYIISKKEIFNFNFEIFFMLLN
jgi:hypothetical protein